MRRATSETNRRRKRQLEYNAANGIDPQTIRKKVTDILEMLRGGDDVPGPARGRRRTKASAVFDLADVGPDELGRLVQSLQEEMHEAAKELRFEEAARLRDEVRELQRELREVG